MSKKNNAETERDEGNKHVSDRISDMRVAPRHSLLSVMTAAAALCATLAMVAAICLTAYGAEGRLDASAQDATGATDRDGWTQQRLRMVERQIRARGISSEPVMAAMRKVPRHLFVSVPMRPSAYEDYPLPIGHGQTISQPYIVAYMTETADVAAHETVLEIGTGSGYQAAVLAELAKTVYTIEIVPELAEGARNTLASLDYKNVFVKTGDGYQGWPEHAPFDAIVVTAAPEKVPEALVAQLAPGGKMVVPVGTVYQEIVIIEKTRAGIVERRTIPVRFVPMVKKTR